MVCCVFQAINLVNNYRQRKSERIFASRQEASNKLYTVLQTVIIHNNNQIHFQVFHYKNLFLLVGNYHRLEYIHIQ